MQKLSIFKVLLVIVVLLLVSCDSNGPERESEGQKPSTTFIDGRWIGVIRSPSPYSSDINFAVNLRTSRVEDEFIFFEGNATMSRPNQNVEFEVSGSYSPASITFSSSGGNGFYRGRIGDEKMSMVGFWYFTVSNPSVLLLSKE